MAVKGVRVMKARRSGIMKCGHFVQIGKQIVRVKGKQWICMECALRWQYKANRPENAGQIVEFPVKE